MVITKSQTYTFAEYLTYADGTQARHELVNGELVRMNPPRGKHVLIARFLFLAFHQETQTMSQDWLPSWDYGLRTGVRKSRLPDLVVMTQAQELDLLEHSAVLEEAPLLAVGIVSPDEPARDYRAKRSEYATAEVPEYWIVDPYQATVTILTLVDGLYEDRVFSDFQPIVSPTFPNLKLTADQILAGKV